MADLLGIIAPLWKFIDNNECIIETNGQQVLEMKKDRVFVIPEFQREIRWDRNNVLQLIEDMYTRPIYLGNAILTYIKDKNQYMIIDGQQRITTLIMIVKILDVYHGKPLDILKPCTLEVMSFSRFNEGLTNHFSDAWVNNSDTMLSDRLGQRVKYQDMWKCIQGEEKILVKSHAENVYKNLRKSELNLLLNTSDDLSEGIKYFIDVNLKGKQLDTEDIFKGYLLQKDSNPEIREAWYVFKEHVIQLNEKIKYPLLDLLEHYFLCDLYNNAQFEGMKFRSDFFLSEDFLKDKKLINRKNTHIVEAINDNSYMLQSINTLTKAVDVMINIVTSQSSNDKFDNDISFVNDSGKLTKLDSTENKLIHNLVKKILLDSLIVPKTLIMKYILSNIINKTSTTKKEIREIYGVYLLSVLFYIFQDKKSKEDIRSVYIAPKDKWYQVLLERVNHYFNAESVSDAKIIASYVNGTNVDDEDNQYRCKSLATVYNYFKVSTEEVSITNINEAYIFVTDSNLFSTEHFVISKTDNKTIKVALGGVNHVHCLPNVSSFHSKYSRSLFNFIFIDEDTNNALDNYWLPYKIMKLNINDVHCMYSLLAIQQLESVKNSMEVSLANGYDENTLNGYLLGKFREEYIDYAKNMLDAVIQKIRS